jgi:sugar transferase (PEP-CTERM/EpsH1 system associated)
LQLLWLTPSLPAPVTGAGTRIFNLLKVLSTTYQIDLIAGSVAGRPDDGMVAEVRSLCRTVQVVPPTVGSRRQKRLLQLRSLAGPHPMHRSIFYSPEMQAEIHRAVEETAYDAAILESSFMGYYALPEQIPRVLDQHNVESEILLRSGQQERSMVRRAYNLLEYRKYRADEQRICREADLILAVSARDREVMTTWSGSAPCVVVPNGVDTEYFSPVDHQNDDCQLANVVFTGTISYSPNTEAILYFAAEIWPLIAQQVPEAALQIVGSGPPAEVLKLARLPHVTVTGTVPDVRPYLAAAQVVVAPLRIGGGTRLKILEAMAMARPVVSTSLGCEGLDVQDEVHLLVADDPGSFAAAAAGLLRNPARRAAMGREGRRLVESSYDWRAVGRVAERAVRELLNTR